MKVKFDFVLEAWMQGVEIEADSYEEALRKLYAMDVEDLISEGYIKESDIKQEEGVITEKTVKVRAYDIDYDVEPEDVDENEEKLIKAICKLVACHAQDFMLHYIDNLTDIEIAKVLSKICNDENNINISNGKIEE